MDPHLVPRAALLAMLAAVAALVLVAAPRRIAGVQESTPAAAASAVPGPTLEPGQTPGTAALLARIRERLAFRGKVDEPLPADWERAQTLATGSFEGAELAGVGSVSILQRDSARLLMLRRFDLDHAPGLQLVLSSARHPRRFGELERTVPLGELREATGQQLFPVPEGLDLSALRSVAVVEPSLQVVVVSAPLVYRY